MVAEEAGAALSMAPDGRLATERPGRRPQRRQGRLRQYRCDRAAFTPERVQACFNGLTRGEVTAYPLPGIHGINSLFLLAQSLDGWSFSSLHLDAQAKTYSQVLLEPETAVPE